MMIQGILCEPDWPSSLQRMRVPSERLESTNRNRWQVCHDQQEEACAYLLNYELQPQTKVNSVDMNTLCNRGGQQRQHVAGFMGLGQHSGTLHAHS